MCNTTTGQYMDMNNHNHNHNQGLSMSLRELKTIFLLNNMVESPVITSDHLLHSTKNYDGKIRLIDSMIDRKILSHCLCHRDICFVNAVIDHLHSLMGTGSLPKDNMENNLIDLMVSWNH
jgi:hypothetical protein